MLVRSTRPVAGAAAVPRPAAPSRLRRFLLLALAPVALAATGCAGDTAAASGETTVLYADPAQRPDAPELSGTDLSDANVDGAAFNGRIVVVNFWASWCAPCRREGPELVSAYEDTRADDVQFLGINIRDDRDKAVAFEKSLGVEYPSIFDPSGRLALEFTDVPPNTIPATIIIDRSGKVAAVFRQELTAKTLTDAIEDVAAE